MIFKPQPLRRDHNKAIRTALLALLFKEGWEVEISSYSFLIYGGGDFKI
jgi:hypothetical protein